MALANPEKENPLEGSGVVLIDELDLHMHTSWQRKVLNVLRDTFPNVQFIITTHSPQILGEMDDSVNLLYLYNEDKKTNGYADGISKARILISGGKGECL